MNSHKSGWLMIHCCRTVALEQPVFPSTSFRTYSLGVLPVAEDTLVLGLIFLQCFDTVGWVIWPVKTRLSRIWPIMYLVGRSTLLCLSIFLQWMIGEIQHTTGYCSKSSDSKNIRWCYCNSVNCCSIKDCFWGQGPQVQGEGQGPQSFRARPRARLP